MGSPYEEAGRDNNEKPHRVSLNYVYALSETEVTFAQWNACVADGGCVGTGTTGAPDATRTLSYTSRGMRRAPIPTGSTPAMRLARNDPYRYRLPTEAEWEYAARAGNSGPFGFAHNKPIAPEFANYDSRASYQGSPTRDWVQGSMPVGSYPVNPFGAKDMLGNVWEWVADCYEPDYERTPRDGSAQREFDMTCPARVVRGGSWSFTPEELRVANRFWAAPGYHDNKGGFRIARTLMPRS